MRIEAGRIVSIEYEVRLQDGQTIEATDSGAPVQYLHGAGMLLPALESVLETMQEGAHKRFVIKARDAYGERDESNVLTLPRSLFPSSLELKEGTRLTAKTASGESYPLTACEIRSDEVVVDLNHPLAGQALHFWVTVRSVRAAGHEELFSGKPKPVEFV